MQSSGGTMGEERMKLRGGPEAGCYCSGGSPLAHGEGSWQSDVALLPSGADAERKKPRCGVWASLDGDWLMMSGLDGDGPALPPGGSVRRPQVSKRRAQG